MTSSAFIASLCLLHFVSTLDMVKTFHIREVLAVCIVLKPAHLSALHFYAAEK